MFWDGSGLWVCAKKMEKGRFRWPEVNCDQNKVQLSNEELASLLGGIDLREAERRRWHRSETCATEILRYSFAPYFRKTTILQVILEHVRSSESTDA